MSRYVIQPILAVATLVFLQACAHYKLQPSAKTEVAQPSRNERPAWTPDGERIVFHSKRDGNFEIYIMGKDGGHQTNLTNTNTIELFPSVSHAGDAVAFVGEVDGNYDIYIMNIDGTNRQRLTDEARIDDWPSWRDNDETILYDYVDGDDYAILSMDRTGGDRKTLIDNAARTVDPTTTNHGKWIIYTSDELAPGVKDLVYRFNMETGESKRLGDLDIDSGHPSLSSDGTKILFNAGEKNWDLYVMDIDGKNLNRLTEGGADNKWGAFSPDGSEIAFTSNRTGEWQIHLMDADGGNVRQLTK